MEDQSLLNQVRSIYKMYNDIYKKIFLMASFLLLTFFSFLCRQPCGAVGNVEKKNIGKKTTLQYGRKYGMQSGLGTHEHNATIKAFQLDKHLNDFMTVYKL